MSKPTKKKIFTPQEEEFYLAVGREIAAQRRAKGLKQSQLATLVGLATVTIAQIETAAQRHNSFTLHNIALALGIRVSDILLESSASKNVDLELVRNVVKLTIREMREDQTPSDRPH